ncbi:MAG: recombinase family protein [Terriglobales bacterium]
MSLRAALYVRVSTGEQSPAMQLSALRPFCAAKGWAIVGEYADLAQSGAKETRPELLRLMADAFAGRFDVLAVWKIDRLSRSLRHLLSTLDQLRQAGVAFASATEPIDTSTPAGQMVLAMIGAMAEFERAIIRERVTAGVRRAITERNGRWGRRRRFVDAELARMLRAEGRKWPEVAKLMGVPLRTLQRKLAATPNTQATE